MRLIHLKGTLNGYKFEIKPVTFEAHEVAEELDEMFKKWHDENNKLYKSFFEEHKQDLESGDFDKLEELFEKMPKLKLWQSDEDFRAEFIRKKAETSMKFDKDIPDDFWKRKDLEYGTVQEAWDFFIGKRVVPQEGITTA
tara:strand:- start:833 stop:1252 length:420 start_codon:yes stop_codon:yes gene_type:complete